jgi:2-polyprenyl-3-methyl-5-hydroxy-6-metoxy-1,4-benzoquinol methylase
MDKSEKFWDRQAKNFDSESEEPDLATLQTVERIQKYLKSGDMVLDYACGTGPMALAVADHVQDVYAIDISSKMLAIAQRKARERNIENIQFAQTTVFDERFSPGSFDMVMAFNILHLLENPGEVILRISELLKPGGVFVSSSACRGEKGKFLGTILNVLSKTGATPPVNKFTIAELEGLITNGRFQIIESEKTVQEVTEYFVVAAK